MGGQRFRRVALVAASAAIALVAAACTPSPETSMASEACAPPGTLIGTVSIAILAAPPGATLEVQRLVRIGIGTPGEDAGIDQEVLGDLQAGQQRTLPPTFRIDPGLCVHVFPSDGVRYQVTLIPADPISQLIWQLGQPSTTSYGYPAGTLPPPPPTGSAPVAVVGLTDAAQVSVGVSHACAVRATGAVACWGANGEGQLGDGTTTPHPAPVAVVGLADAVQVAAGIESTCAVRSDGTVACWGSNEFGELGNGTTTTPSSVPVDVTGLDDAVAVTVGGDHACALRSGGLVSCWGRNNRGQFGTTGGTSSSVPVETPGLSGLQVLSTAKSHTCAVATDATAACWGDDDSGQLGDGTPGTNGPDGFPPGPVSNIADVAEVSTGEHHTCAVSTNGSAWCWGDDSYLQLGNGPAGTSAVPVPVSGLVDAVSISAGWFHSCAIRAGGSVACWGENNQQLLGDGTQIDRDSPVPVTGITDAVQVSAGTGSTCAVRAGGGVTCWGSDGAGQLGDG